MQADIGTHSTESILVFCNPAEAYRGMREREVATAYQQMAIDEYDALLKFSSEHERWKEVPDIVDGYWKKENLHIGLKAFLAQEVERVGEVEGPLISSSFMFNPINPRISQRLLPDLDVINMVGENAAQAMQRVRNLYERHGWRTEIFEGNIPVINLRLADESRLLRMPRWPNSKPTTYDPDALLKIAQRVVGYDSKRLCWRK